MARKKADETVENVTETTESVTEPVETESKTVEMVTETAESQTVQLMYVGATVPGMKENTVFTGTIPEVIDVPFVRELCIPITDLAKFKKQKAVTSSRRAFCYRKSMELANSLKK